MELEIEESPKEIPQCHQVQYLTEVESEIGGGGYGWNYWDVQPNILSLTYRSSIVETIQSVTSYDVQNLIGDIGGALGLFLGFCGISFLAGEMSPGKDHITKVFT